MAHADYLATPAPGTNWPALLGTSIGTGVLLGSVLAAAILLTGRRVVVVPARDQ